MTGYKDVPTLDIVDHAALQPGELDRGIADYAHRIEQRAKQNETTHRLMQVEGMGPMSATAPVATVGEGHACQNGRQFAAWLALVLTQHSTGGKTVLGRITKHGNVYLRTLLIQGARTVLSFSTNRANQKSRWVEGCSGTGTTLRQSPGALSMPAFSGPSWRTDKTISRSEATKGTLRGIEVLSPRHP